MQRNAHSNLKFSLTLVGTLKRYIREHIFPVPIKEKDVVTAYDLWAANYDAQPGNLMLYLDQQIFNRLLNTDLVKNRQVADIGCGTGRHWPKILNKHPLRLTGFDVSPGMLNKLREKYPVAQTNLITDNLFSAIETGTFDTIISTLTIAHIENMEAALKAWSRILKAKGDIIITDFHPDTLASGGKRTFRHQNTQIAVRNFVHPVARIRQVLFNKGFSVVAEEEIIVDEQVKHYYGEQNALHVYEKFKGSPIIYGLHFRRG
ncbi:hypothetical protein BH09BAC6_BH09BAC6_11710 [soil metagenome]|jgi:ubiquinone/menaquinone biosynthesis C-methylase UbiE